MGCTVENTSSQYHLSSHWDMCRCSDCHQFQHLCGSGFPEQCPNRTLLLLIFRVAGHWQANSAYDDVVLKPCAKVINVLQWRQVIYTSWKSSSVLQLVHSIAKTFRPSCTISSHVWWNFSSQQQELLIPRNPMSCRKMGVMVVCQPVSAVLQPLAGHEGDKLVA